MISETATLQKKRVDLLLPVWSTHLYNWSGRTLALVLVVKTVVVVNEAWQTGLLLDLENSGTGSDARAAIVTGGQRVGATLTGHVAAVEDNRLLVRHANGAQLVLLELANFA